MKFEMWFRAQYGKRPSRRTAQELEEILAAYLHHAQETENELLKLNDYLMRWDVAYKAWLAKEPK